MKMKKDNMTDNTSAEETKMPKLTPEQMKELEENRKGFIEEVLLPTFDSLVEIKAFIYANHYRDDFMDYVYEEWCNAIEKDIEVPTWRTLVETFCAEHEARMKY